jgi:hypothetical protein
MRARSGGSLVERGGLSRAHVREEFAVAWTGSDPRQLVTQQLRERAAFQCGATREREEDVVGDIVNEKRPRHVIWRGWPPWRA